MRPSIIVDNFFRNPLLVRMQALTYKYYDMTNHPDSSAINEFPGVRTLDACIINKKVHEYSFKRVSDALKKNGIEKIINPGPFEFRANFSLTYKDTKFGYHKDVIYPDGSVSYAGVVYLSPFANPSQGTTIVLPNEKYEVENRFNRMVVYPTDTYHSLSGSFGTNKFNARMVMSLFFNLIDP